MELQEVTQFIGTVVVPFTIILVGLLVSILGAVAAALVLSLMLVEKSMKVLGVHKILLEYILHRPLYRAWLKERKERIRERTRRIEADIKRRSRHAQRAVVDDPQSTPPATPEEADERRQALKKIIEDAQRDTDDPPDRLDG